MNLRSSCIIRVLAITNVSSLSVFVLRTLFLRIDEVRVVDIAEWNADAELGKYPILEKDEAE